jgi:hypothetical protein
MYDLAVTTDITIEIPVISYGFSVVVGVGYTDTRPY